MSHEDRNDVDNLGHRSSMRLRPGQSGGKTVWFRISLMIALLTGLVTAASTLSAQPPEDPTPATDQNATGGTSANDVGQTASGESGSGPTSGAGATPATGSGIAASPATTPTETAIPTGAWEVATAMGIPFSAAFAVASVIALWSAIERLVMLRQRRVIPRAFVDRFLMHLRTGRMEKVEALTVCQQNQSPIADVFMHGVRKWGKPSVEIEQAIIDGGERQVSLLKKRLRILNGVATITPLIGLLGTVVGMIQSFNKIAVAQAMGQSQVLAEGIALALLTTAAGLFIAIPALTAYMYLAGKVDGLVMEMDRLGQELVYLISAEALRERAVQPTESKPRKPAAAPATRPESPSA